MKAIRPVNVIWVETATDFPFGHHLSFVASCIKSLLFRCTGLLCFSILVQKFSPIVHFALCDPEFYGWCICNGVQYRNYTRITGKLMVSLQEHNLLCDSIAPGTNIT